MSEQQQIEARAAPSASNYLVGELASLAACLYLAGSILYGLTTKPSDAYYSWSNTIQGLIIFEFVLVGAGTMAVLMSGKANPPGIEVAGPDPKQLQMQVFASIVFLLFGLAYGLWLFKFSFLFLVYMARLIASVWTGFTAPAGRALEMAQRRGFGAIAYVTIVCVVVANFGNGNEAFMWMGALYFSVLALIELVMLLRRPPA